MKKFKVSYYWRTAGDDIDWETHEVEASNEEEAEEKIMKKLGRVKGFYKVKVEPMEENNDFKRMQELANIVKEEDDVQNVWGNIDDGVIYDNLIDVDVEWLVSEMMSQVESDPSTTLLDFLKQYGEEE